jgi:hypothetical protein
VLLSRISIQYLLRERYEEELSEEESFIKIGDLAVQVRGDEYL